jgi:hypothetical protein
MRAYIPHVQFWIARYLMSYSPRSPPRTGRLRRRRSALPPVLCLYTLWLFRFRTSGFKEWLHAIGLRACRYRVVILLVTPSHALVCSGMRARLRSAVSIRQNNYVFEAFSCHLAAAYSPFGVRTLCSLEIQRHRVVVLRGDFTSPVPLALASLKPIALQSCSVPVCVMQIARKLVHADNFPAVHGHAVHCGASHLLVKTFLANILLSLLVICGRSHIYVELLSTSLRLDNRFVHSQRAFSFFLSL